MARVLASQGQEFSHFCIAQSQLPYYNINDPFSAQGKWLMYLQ